jgi:cytochrome c-type biogenesis protein CcsB
MGVATCGYLAAWLLYWRALRKQRDELSLGDHRVTWLAWGLHVASLSVRAYRAEHMPIYNAYEFLSVFGGGIVLVQLIFERLSRRRDLGVFILPVALAILFYAWSHSRMVEPVLPIFKGFWLKVHVLTEIVAYSSFAATFGASLLYLFRGVGSNLQPDARDTWDVKLLDDVAYRAALIGFSFHTIGIISGGIWAEYVWGRFWGWDPKETWSLITWLIFAAYIHTRYHRGWRGRRAALLAVAGFLAVLITYLGVDLLMYRQHNFLFWKGQ